MPPLCSRNRLLSIRTALALPALMPAFPAAAEVIRVSPGGPVPSLPDALAVVAEHRKTYQETPVIEVGSGRYELQKPVRIGPEHMGTGKAAGLIIRGTGPDPVVLSGGRLLDGWEPDPARSGRWKTRVQEVDDDARGFTELYLDGARMTRARTPDTGSWFLAAGRPGSGSPITIPVHRNDVVASGADRPGAELVMLMKWTDLHVPVRGFDADRGVLVVPGGPPPAWMDEPDARYWIENVADAVDAPGEWFLDRTSGEVTIIPPGGTDMRTARVVAPQLSELIRIEGSEAVAVRGLRLENLTFSETHNPLPDDGLISPQAAVAVRGVVRATHAILCSVTDCTFRCLAGYALDLGRGTQHWQITGNTFAEIGAGGIRVGEPGDRDPSAADACHSHAITDNRLTRLGRVFPSGCGILVLQSGRNRIAHNHIQDLYYTGISVGWTWGYKESPCRENVIAFNLVEDIGQGMLSDMGGIYTLGPQPGTIIRNNVFRNITSYRYGGWGMYTDEGSSGIVLENNVAAHCSDAGFHQHYGRDNLVRNNILAWNRRHSVMRTRLESHLSFEFTRNIVVADSGTLLGSSLEGTPEHTRYDRNVWFDTRHGENAELYAFANGIGWAAWRERGHDIHSVIADPLFVDPDRPESGLRADSPAYSLGFKPIDFSGLGPRPANERRSRP